VWRSRASTRREKAKTLRIRRALIRKYDEELFHSFTVIASHKMRTGFTDFQPYNEVPTLLLYFSSSGEIVYEISIKYPGH
jgi:hypothetical protein